MAELPSLPDDAAAREAPAGAKGQLMERRLWTLDEDAVEEEGEEEEGEGGRTPVKRDARLGLKGGSVTQSFRNMLSATSGVGHMGSRRRLAIGKWRKAKGKVAAMAGVTAALSVGLKARLKGVNETRVTTGEELVKAAEEVDGVLEEHERQNKPTWSLLKGIRSIFRMLNVSAQVSPVTITTYEAPETKESKAFKGMTEAQAIEHYMRKTLKEKNLVVVNEGATEYVPLQQQVDLAFETNEVRMQRVLLRRSPAIREAVLTWWVELGMSNRKRGFSKTATGALGKMRKAANRLALGVLLAGGSSKTLKADEETKAPAKVEEEKKEETKKKGAAANKFTAAVGKVEMQNATTGAGVMAMLRKGAKKGKDKREEGYMTRSDYMLMCRELYILLGQDAMTEKEAKKAAAEDWKKDSRGLQKMDFSAFFDAIFELADLYTFSVSEDDYCRFLRKTLERLEKPIVVSK